MAQKLGITDYIYYGVRLKVKSIIDIENNGVMVEFKPLYCRGELRDLKDLTLVYFGKKTNKGLFGFKYQEGSQIQTYSLTLKSMGISADRYVTNRIFVDKPGRK